MTWDQDPGAEADDDEACVLLGEEDGPQGYVPDSAVHNGAPSCAHCPRLSRKQWFVCTEPSDAPGAECTKETLGIDEDADYLCKTPKVRVESSSDRAADL